MSIRSENLREEGEREGDTESVLWNGVSGLSLLVMDPPPVASGLMEKCSHPLPGLQKQQSAHDWPG